MFLLHPREIIQPLKIKSLRFTDIEWVIKLNYGTDCHFEIHRHVCPGSRLEENALF